mmetsp:Transcript_114746/g.329565  ORF Transcript_114746/g.329565 Transcript_114746/m.329565 type:complete len:342 (+) Transcript_114746:1147-2172(+)
MPSHPTGWPAPNRSAPVQLVAAYNSRGGDTSRFRILKPAAPSALICQTDRCAAAPSPALAPKPDSQLTPASAYSSRPVATLTMRTTAPSNWRAAGAVVEAAIAAVDACAVVGAVVEAVVAAVDTGAAWMLRKRQAPSSPARTFPWPPPIPAESYRPRRENWFRSWKVPSPKGMISQLPSSPTAFGGPPAPTPLACVCPFAANKARWAAAFTMRYVPSALRVNIHQQSLCPAPISCAPKPSAQFTPVVAKRQRPDPALTTTCVPPSSELRSPMGASSPPEEGEVALAAVVVAWVVGAVVGAGVVARVVLGSPTTSTIQEPMPRSPPGTSLAGELAPNAAPSS